MIKSKQTRDSVETGCEGLLAGTALTQRTGERVYASSSTRSDGPFLCEECFSDAVVHKCTEKADHFAHHCRTSPVPSRESALHDAAKREICAALSKLFPSGRWETEREIPAKPQKDLARLKPDVSGRIGGGDGKPVAIEVQASALTIPRILSRTSEYAKRRISICWVVPLTEPLGTAIFRPRLFERYLHSLYFGRIYYWVMGGGSKLVPVHFGNAVRHIDYSEWYEDGEVKEAGGYDKTYKILKTPVYGPDIDLSADFVSEFRRGFIPDNERKKIPACHIWRDTLRQWWKGEQESPARTTE